MGNSFKTFSPRHYAPRGVNSSPHFHNGGLGQDLQLWGGRGQLLERPGYDLQAEVSSPKFTLRFLPTVMAVNTSCGPAVCQALGRTEHTSSQLNLHGGPWGSHSHPILQMGDWTSVTASNLSKGTQPGWGWGGAGAAELGFELQSLEGPKQKAVLLPSLFSGRVFFCLFLCCCFF